MSMRKAEGRGVRRSSANGGARRLGREMVEELEQLFRGERSSAWCLLIPPECDYCVPEVFERWKQFRSDNPRAAMPRALAAAILAKVREARTVPEARELSLPPDLDEVRLAAGEDMSVPFDEWAR